MPNLPILSNQQLNNNSGDNMRTGIAQWINTILMIFGVIGGGAFYLAKMDSKIDSVAKSQNEIMTTFKENQQEFKTLAQIIQKHDVEIEKQKEKNDNIYDKIKNVDEKIDNTKEVILYKNSKGVKWV